MNHLYFCIYHFVLLEIFGPVKKYVNMYLRPNPTCYSNPKIENKGSSRQQHILSHLFFFVWLYRKASVLYILLLFFLSSNFFFLNLVICESVTKTRLLCLLLHRRGFRKNKPKRGSSCPTSWTAGLSGFTVLSGFPVCSPVFGQSGLKARSDRLQVQSGFNHLDKNNTINKQNYYKGTFHFAMSTKSQQKGLEGGRTWCSRNTKEATQLWL